MSLYDILIFQKLAGAMSAQGTLDASHGRPTNVGGIGTLVPMTESITLSAPGTSYATIVDVSGSGFLLTFVLRKPSTVNAVRTLYKVTLDGTAIVTDGLGSSGTATAARQGVMVGQVQVLDSSAPDALPPVFLPFHTSLKIEAKYNSDPGGTEDISANILVVYS